MNPHEDGKGGMPRDPFESSLIWTELRDGQPAIDMVASAEAANEASLPQVNVGMLVPGDVLTVDTEDSASRTYTITDKQVESYTFGSDEAIRPVVRAQRQAADGSGADVEIIGSSLLPGGGLRTINVLRTGSWLLTSEGISDAPLTSFDIKRPDANGDLQPLRMNAESLPEPSEEYAAAQRTFAALKGHLADRGFTFGEMDTRGCDIDFIQQEGDTFVYAARQGFGSAVRPQDAIYIYDAATQVIRGIRNIPGEGVVQTMVAQGVDTDAFADAFIGYNDQGEKDWRGVHIITPSSIPSLANKATVVTHTWTDPSQRDPTVTVMRGGKEVSPLLQTPDSRFAQTLELTLAPGEEPRMRRGNHVMWGSNERADEVARAVEATTSVARKGDRATVTVDGTGLTVPIDGMKELAGVEALGDKAFGVTKRFAGGALASLVRRIRGGLSRQA